MGANKGREFELVEVVPFEIQENSNQCDRSADWSIKMTGFVIQSQNLLLNKGITLDSERFDHLYGKFSCSFYLNVNIIRDCIKNKLDRYF